MLPSRSFRARGTRWLLDFVDPFLPTAGQRLAFTSSREGAELVVRGRGRRGSRAIETEARLSPGEGLRSIELRVGDAVRRALVLSLGGTVKQAIHPILKQSIKSSLIPTIESQKTIGLVQLPGMMSGQIIAGADPLQAVRFQLLIVFLIMSAASITAIILGLLIYPSLFNKDQQLDIGRWK